MFHGIPDYYTLGEMLIDVPYVIRRCQEDSIELQQQKQKQSTSEDMLVERGISGAMASEFDPEKRLHMLLVHGMLHLVGYDHETDQDYEEMVTKEEEFLKKLDLPSSCNKVLS